MSEREQPTITQAMIEAYDEYTHLTLDRRGFMERLTRLAGSATAAAAIAPLIGASAARAEIVPADDSRLSTVWMEIRTPDGPLRGYLAKPGAGEGPWPASLVFHENRGLNPHIQDVARRLALDGFVAFAPDFLTFDGGTPPDEDRAREMIGALDAARTVRAASAARGWLASEADVDGGVGAVGFCWGGGLVNDLAVADPELAAGVAYYGRQPDAAGVPAIRAAILLHYAGLDERINAGIPAYRAALEAAGTEHAIHLYEGVNHAFNNDTSAARYDKAASDLAWERTTAFLREHAHG